MVPGWPVGARELGSNENRIGECGATLAAGMRLNRQASLCFKLGPPEVD